MVKANGLSKSDSNDKNKKNFPFTDVFLSIKERKLESSESIQSISSDNVKIGLIHKYIKLIINYYKN